MQLAFKKAVTDAIKKQPDRRVMPFLYENEPYFIKRRLSNHRNRFAKQSVDAAFWCEVYKILTVNQYGPMAPEIVLLHDDYFVMKAVWARPSRRSQRSSSAGCAESFHKAEKL